MLKSMREGMKPVMWIVAIAFVGAIFLWGASTSVKLLGEHKQNVMAQLGKDTVEKDEFMDYLAMEYYITRTQYEQIYGQNITPEIEQEILVSSGRKTLEMLIHMKLLMQEANSLGIVVSDDEVRKYVRRSPYFLDKNGEFSFPQYEEILANYFHTTPAFFEEQIRKEIYSSNLVDLILASARFTDQDLKDIYLQSKKSADISILFFPAKDYLNQVDVASLDVEQYFQQNKDKYQLPRQAKIRYIFIDLKQMEKELAITDDMLLSYYEEHKTDYAQAGLIHLRAILFNFPDKATTAQKDSARDKALAVVAKLKAGGNFAELAKTYSEDPFTAQNGGDMGFVPPGVSGIPTLDEAVKSLEEGQYTTTPVETTKGYYLLYREADIPAFEDEKEKIKQKLSQTKAQESAMNRSQEIYQALIGGRDIDNIATELGLEARSTEYFGDDGNIKGLGTKPDLTTQIFILKKVGDVGQVYENYEYSMMMPQPVLTGYYVYILEDRREAHIPEFSEVEEKVTEDAKTAEAVKIARQSAEKILSSTSGKSINALASSAKLEVKKISGVTEEKGITGIGKYENLLDWIFSAQTGSLSPVLETPKGACIILVDKLTIPSDADISAGLDETYKTAYQDFSTKLYHDYYISLRQKVQILITPEEILGIYGKGKEEGEVQEPSDFFGF